VCLILIPWEYGATSSIDLGLELVFVYREGFLQ
jgi:hypothetical protein